MYFKKEKLQEATITVTVEVENTDNVFPVKADEFTITKSMGPDRVVRHFIGSMPCGKDEYYHLLESGGIGRTKNYSFLNARLIEKIANLQGEELYEMLKDLTGAKVYESKKEESISILEKTGKLNSS